MIKQQDPVIVTEWKEAMVDSSLEAVERAYSSPQSTCLYPRTAPLQSTSHEVITDLRRYYFS